MPTLRELQGDFARFLLGGPDAAIAAAVAGDELAPAQRLQIYRNHVRISLREALKASYPSVAALVGDDFFAAMAGPYIDANPPRSPCLHEYGGDFSAYVGEFEAAKTLPYLAGMARLDWSLNCAYHAALVQPATLQQLAEIDPDAYAYLRIGLQEGVTFLASDYPLDRIWAMCQPGAPDEKISLAEGGVMLEIRRQGDRGIFGKIAPDRFALRMALARNALLAEAVEQAGQAAQAAHREFDLAGELAALFNDGLVAHIVLDR